MASIYSCVEQWCHDRHVPCKQCVQEEGQGRESGTDIVAMDVVQSSAEQSRAEQSGTEQLNTEQSSTEQSRAEQSGTEHLRAEQSSTEQSKAECIIIKCSFSKQEITNINIFQYRFNNSMKSRAS